MRESAHTIPSPVSHTAGFKWLWTWEWPVRLAGVSVEPGGTQERLSLMHSQLSLELLARGHSCSIVALNQKFSDILNYGS